MQKPSCWTLRGALTKVIYLATLPLRVLCFHGPRLGGYGLEGVSNEHACEQFTSVRSEFWAGSRDASGECNEILERKFNAFVVGLCALVIGGTCYQYLQFLTARRAVTPTVERLEDVLRHLQKHEEIYAN